MTKNNSIHSSDLSGQGSICFPDGLIGLEHMKNYTLLSPEGNLPFQYLQSLEDETLAFVVIDPYLYMPDYSFDIFEDVIEGLEVSQPSDLLVLVVVVIPQDATQMTANFAAPVLINVNTRRAKQIVLQDNKYQIRQPVFDIYRNIQSQGAKQCSF